MTSKFQKQRANKGEEDDQEKIEILILKLMTFSKKQAELMIGITIYSDKTK